MTEKKVPLKETKVEKNTVDSVYAETVNCSKAAIKSINAGNAELDQCAVGYLRAQSITQSNCGNAVVMAKTLKTDSVKSLVTISDHIDGDVTTILDKKGAAVFALVFASVFMFFRILRGK